MPELGSLGSVRGALSNGRPYREHCRPFIETAIDSGDKRKLVYPNRASHSASAALMGSVQQAHTATVPIYEVAFIRVQNNPIRFAVCDFEHKFKHREV